MIQQLEYLGKNFIYEFYNKGHIFGEAKCYMYTIEWQKRGLPHAHTLFWLNKKLPVDHIDKIITAELPNEQVDHDLSNIVKTQMINGPCGAFNPKALLILTRVWQMENVAKKNPNFF